MKRLHIHVAVADLAQSIDFYSKLFGAAPTVSKPDYAKWMVDDPRVNFAISARGIAPGIDHLGIQVDSDAELETLRGRLDAAGIGLVSQEVTTCCYAESNKHWVSDPQGIAWETYHTMREAPTFGQSPREVTEATETSKTTETTEAAAACCAPATQAIQFLKTRAKA